MKKVLVLGAGLVAGPLVRYLLDQEGFQVKVASRTLKKAERLIGEAKNGIAQQLDVSEQETLERLIGEADLSISLLPYLYHPLVAKLCIEHTKHMVTASYVKDEMRALDAGAKKAGVILLNEIGVDPGIDHMSAMQVIDQIKASGGELVSFSSYCGGLPAPEANDNPFGYKFSWSPRGVVLAGKNSACYLKDGKVVDIPGEELFTNHWSVTIEGLGTLEGYPNRDAIPYIKTYGISGVKGMFRGTLRYPGWCETMNKIAELGFLDEAERDGLVGLTFRGLTAVLIGSSGEDLKTDLAAFLNLDVDSPAISNMEWLGLLSDDPLPQGAKSPLDVLATRMLDKMHYAPFERDMLVMQHEFISCYSDRTQKTTSTLIDYGIPYGDSSMSRLVGLPAAIAAKLILLGEIDLVGVQVPVVSEIYDPVLAELAQMGVEFTEKTEVIGS
ncbi:saccharopine dehydrogenase NADP-binding domain-containing protein [Candidatus Bipolaricaulota bacterium]|nr:saccharopine dehydrogenase NADP-binding domain-containing protein [Candidatus Bipolaricaulota bacterium]